jgi:hypothetical protein
MNLTRRKLAMNLPRLLVIHAVVTLAAGIALIVSPNLVPGAIGIHLDPGQYLISYLLGASELGIAFLSFFAKNLEDTKAVRLTSWTFIVFHLATAVVEVYALTQGVTFKYFHSETARCQTRL